jgi:putative peptide zinc metalloprotease protein
MDQPTSLQGSAGAARRPAQSQPAEARQAAQPPPQPVAVEVPERPKLAPGVRPAGQMQESGFKNPPWLIEREGERYIQVTELLHKIAEHCTGEYTPDEIAAKITESGTPVRVETIRSLLAQLLIPRGLVEAKDGTVMSAGQAELSPLAVNMKMARVSPRVFNPLTAVLQVLYWPPVLLLALAASAAVQAWVLIVHGVGGSLHNLLYAPALMLAAMGFILVAAAFHELGHAAALRYGGGQARTMGIGLYLIYPAFYTDVSDNYRLGRWARVRTDLGGFYFNLLFALAVVGLYAITGWEFLLVLVLLLDLEILRQSLPFVRLDGYWALADITGIPDFFSNVGPFLRSLLPIKKWQGRKMPELKWWAKAVFITYILVTVPVLLFLLFVMIEGVPRLLATTVDSYRNLAGGLTDALSKGDILGILASAVQMITLAIPVLGTAFILYVLGKKLLIKLWTWASPTPARRAAGMLGSALLFGLLAYLWAPQIPGFLPGGGQEGLLYRQANFTPIQPGERGRLQDAVAAVPVLGSGVSGGEAAATETPTPTPSSTPTATATGTPAARQTATAAPVRTATVPAAVVTPTAIAVSPTPVRTASPAATATPVATAPSGAAAPATPEAASGTP